MPYLTKTCTKCGHRQRRMHDQAACPRCGAASGMQPDNPPEPANKDGEPLLSGDQRRAIRAAREAKGLTRVECGELVGLAATTIYQLERGRSNVRVEILRQLCGYLGLAVDVIIREQTASERRAFTAGLAATATNGAAKKVWRRHKKGAAT